MASTPITKQEADAYNAKLTNHLFTRMVMNPTKTQYKADYDNRSKQFKVATV